MKSNKKGFILPPQLHANVRRSVINQEEFRDVQNGDYYPGVLHSSDIVWLHRPRFGLWTSSYDETYGSDWIQWNLNCENGGLLRDTYTAHLLHPSDDMKVYVLDEPDDLVKLMRRFKRSSPTNKAKKIPFLDFERISKQYDALHLTKRGLLSLANTEPHTLDFWDCESTIWFNLGNVKVVECLGEMKYPKQVNFGN